MYFGDANDEWLIDEFTLRIELIKNVVNNNVFYTLIIYRPGFMHIEFPYIKLYYKGAHITFSI